ncbi:MAG: hypothetical protein QG592_1242 [Pseudomonadota bacterium]|nr:hypothetical protein [Pseudomonadota bacterium]
MASNVTVTIKFNRFPEIAAALPGQTKAVVRKAAFDVEGQAKNRVPVDTGALKSSILTEIENGGLAAEVAPHENYALFVELGTRRMSAQPYMIPAADAVRPAFIAACEQMLKGLK